MKCNVFEKIYIKTVIEIPQCTTMYHNVPQRTSVLKLTRFGKYSISRLNFARPKNTLRGEVRGDGLKTNATRE